MQFLNESSELEKQKLSAKEFEEWLDHIAKEISALYLNRLIFDGVLKIISSNPSITTADQRFIYWLTLNHLITVAVEMRRLVDPDFRKQTKAFLTLLKELKESPDILFRKTPGFDPLMLSTDEDELSKELKMVKNYVDKRIAHYDKGENPNSINVSEVNKALDGLRAMFQKYYTLYHGSPCTYIDPDIGDNWKEIFYSAWIPSRITKAELAERNLWKSMPFGFREVESDPGKEKKSAPVSTKAEALKGKRKRDR